MMQSPLKRHEIKPNLRKVPKPDISTSTSPSKNKGRKRIDTNGLPKSSIPKIKPGMMILISLIIGTLGFAYLTHVFATQKLLQEVQVLENEYNKARQVHDELKLQYDQLIGPAEIYEKAQEAGFINGGPADFIITVEE